MGLHRAVLRPFVVGGRVFPVNRDASVGALDMSREVIDGLLKATKRDARDIDGLIVGNMLSPVLQKQSQVASSVASNSELGKNIHRLDTLTVESACSSGGSAIRTGIMAVSSGLHKNVIVLGLEQMMPTEDYGKDHVTSGLAQASDWPTEGSQGKTFVMLNDILMGEYINRYADHINPDDFYYISKVAHDNAMTSPHAVLRRGIGTQQDYLNSMKLGNYVRLMDACPIANGCAAVLITSEPRPTDEHPIAVTASSCGTDHISLKQREDLLALSALGHSVQDCLDQAGLKREEISLYETHDAYSIMCALCLEVGGFIPKGTALSYAKSGALNLHGGELPVSTFGGLKARGHPVGASGVYQIYEAMLQLQNKAGENQVKDAKNALVSSFGGAGTTVVSHILSG